MYQTIQVFAFVFKQAFSFPRATILRLCTGLVWAFITSVQPYLLKDIINRLSTCSATDVFIVLRWPVGLYLLSYVVQSVGFLLHGYFVEARMVPNLRRKIAVDATNLLLGKSYRFYQDQFSGAIANRVNDLGRATPDIIEMLFDRLFSHALAFGIALFFLWSVSPYFAVFTITWAGLFFCVLYFFSYQFVDLSARYAARGADMTGYLVDFFSNIMPIRLFSSEVSERHILHKSFDRVQRAEKRLGSAYVRMWFFFDFSFCGLQALNFYFLCYGVSQSWLSVGDYALVLVLNSSVLQVLYRLSRDFSKFSKYYGQVAQALLVIGDAPTKPTVDKRPDLRVAEGQIVFDQVQFHYATGVSLFNDKSVVIEPGQKVGLVGYSGSGKSTFVNLILGLYSLQSGQILIDGQDINCVNQSSLRRAISMIPQDPSLFNRTLMENIRYGRPDATDEAVIAAAKQAHAHEFIIALDDGYHTCVGERGTKISGGQRQRIAIARAILKNAPILILDEATSQLDSQTEKDIQESMQVLMQNKTSIVIAHRLSTLLDMDRILVLNRGMIVEDGTHQSLLRSDTLYKKLWDTQVGGFLPDH